eukprot:GHVR01099010.1.p1 GENE.GHVR01099010.1~~GHVR01099010.1.p1  ORF type:complete len:311 (-),score=49.06 GHVR01099010.1:101-1033(-)
MKDPATIIGLCIGDALGMPFEFCSAEQIQKYPDWNGEFLPGIQGEKNLQPGQWTDDGKMATCLAKSLIDCKEFDLEDVASNYIKWFNSGDLRGIGIQTGRAIYNMIQGDLKNSGKITTGKINFKSKHNPDFAGNGTCMRVSPIGLFYRKEPDKIIKYAIEDAKLTHDHKSAKDASVAIAYLTGLLANGEDKIEAVLETIAVLDDGNVKSKLKESMELMDENWDRVLELGSDGTAHETVGSAVCCFLRYDNFKDVIVNSVRIGGDTDSRAAVSGTLAGTYYGLQGIPQEYLDQLELAEMLHAYDVVLFNGF